MRLSERFQYNLLKTKENIYLTNLNQNNYKPKYKIADPACWVGIEIEVENVPKSGIIDENGFLWRRIKDGSLRNNGYEYVSAPIRGRLIEVALTQLHESLIQFNPKHEFSDRTSVHIHLNVRHLTTEQLVMFLITYIALEPLFFKYTESIPNANRKENNYCVPIDSSKYMLNIPTYLGKFLATNDVAHLETLIHYWRKYTAFNLRPIAEHADGRPPLGTVEFRHMGGNCNVEYIINWINMIQSLRKFVKSHSMEEVKKKLFDLNCNSAYSNFLYECLGTDLNIPFHDLTNLLEDSVSSSKEIFALVERIKNTAEATEEFVKSPLANYLNSILPNAVGIVTKSDISAYEKLIKKIETLKEEYYKQDDEDAKAEIKFKLATLKTIAYAEEKKLLLSSSPARNIVGVDPYEVFPV